MGLVSWSVTEIVNPHCEAITELCMNSNICLGDWDWERANPPLGLGFRVTSFDEKVSTNIKIYYLNTTTGAMLEFSFPD